MVLSITNSHLAMDFWDLLIDFFFVNLAFSYSECEFFFCFPFLLMLIFEFTPLLVLILWFYKSIYSLLCKSKDTNNFICFLVSFFGCTCDIFVGIFLFVVLLVIYMKESEKLCFVTYIVDIVSGHFFCFKSWFLCFVHVFIKL